MKGVPKLPPGVELSPLSARVFAVLERYTVFPWPVLAAQCKRQGLDPTCLTAADLTAVTIDLATGVGRFTSPEIAQAVERELESLVRSR